MKNIPSLLLLVMTFIGFNSFAQKKDCQRFKNGTFKIERTTTSKECILVRKGNIQTEQYEGEDFSVEFIINWIDECTYTLTPTKETRVILGIVAEDATLTVKILETNEDAYIQESKANFAEFKYVGKVIKIE